MRYQLKVSELEPVYHARTAAELMLHDINIDDTVTPKAHAVMRAAYQAVPADGTHFELRNLMASIATAHVNTLNLSAETKSSVIDRCVEIIEEARRLCE